MNLRLHRWGCWLALVVACGDDEGGGDEQGSASEGATADDDVGSSGASASTDGTTNGEGSTSIDGSASVDGSSDGGASTSAGDSGSDTAGLGCGTAPCGADETCVNPCCGGPAPLCYPASPAGTCEGADTPVPPERCQLGGCEAELCCDPAGCMPDPPYCVATDQLSCDGTQCSVDACFGQLDRTGALDCQCA
jgi:hypothetical protein